MRRLSFFGLLVVTALVSAPAARASDESVRAVVQQQADRQTTEDEKFAKAVKKLNTKAQLRKARTATKKLMASIDTFHDAVVPERADTERVAEGRRELLDALNLYNRGLGKLDGALREAIRDGGNSGDAKAKSALRTLTKALKQIKSAARKIHN